MHNSLNHYYCTVTIVFIKQITCIKYITNVFVHIVFFLCNQNICVWMLPQNICMCSWEMAFSQKSSEIICIQSIDMYLVTVSCRMLRWQTPLQVYFICMCKIPQATQLLCTIYPVDLFVMIWCKATNFSQAALGCNVHSEVIIKCVPVANAYYS